MSKIIYLKEKKSILSRGVTTKCQKSDYILNKSGFLNKKVILCDHE